MEDRMTPLDAAYEAMVAAPDGDDAPRLRFYERLADGEMVLLLEEEAQGEKLIPSGRDKRLASDHSITVRDNQWFDHATGEGGLAVDFVRAITPALEAA